MIGARRDTEGVFLQEKAVRKARSNGAVLTLGRLLVGALAMALVAGATAGDGAELEIVELDPGSGVFSSRFPFDVPFVITGKAPPGTTRVEVVYREKLSPSDAFGELLLVAFTFSGAASRFDAGRQWVSEDQMLMDLRSMNELHFRGAPRARDRR